MTESIPKATHTGKLKIGDLVLSCAVLEDETRVFSAKGMTKALGGKRGGAHWKRRKASGEGAHLPVFISATNLEPFIPPELRKALTEPIIYLAKNRKRGNGVEATLLPDICDVWLKARDAGVLLSNQEHIAEKADILMRGLAHVGVIALVDEATGYQDIRDRDALHHILAAYISPELLPWTKRFPEEFYQELFRLMGWQYSPLSVKRPKLVGKMTNELVYEQLPNGVLNQLRRVTPKDEKGRRKHRFHQRLTEDVGNPHLGKQLAAVTTLMRAAPNRAIFKRLFARAFSSAVRQGEFDLGELGEQ